MTALRGPQRDPAAAERLRGAVRDGGRRPRLHRVRLQLSRRRADARAGGARQRLPADAGAAARLRGLRDRRELHHGPAQPRPRPARASELAMSQMQPVAADEGVPGGELIPLDLPVQRARSKRRAGCRCRSGCGCCSRNPKSRFGLIVIAIMIVVGVFAPLDRHARPERLLAARREAGPVAATTSSARPTRAPTSSRRSSGARARRSSWAPPRP